MIDARCLIRVLGDIRPREVTVLGELRHVRAARFIRMAQVVVAERVANPVRVRLLHAQTVVFKPQTVASFIQ